MMLGGLFANIFHNNSHSEYNLYSTDIHNHVFNSCTLIGDVNLYVQEDIEFAEITLDMQAEYYRVGLWF